MGDGAATWWASAPGWRRQHIPLVTCWSKHPSPFYFPHFKNHYSTTHTTQISFLVTMSDTETTLEQPSTPPQPDPSAAVSFSIWPPTQRTRDAVVNRLIETLSAPSVLSKRYGTLSSDESSSSARQIEDEAFSAAASSAASSSDGIEILQVYSKEISKRMLDTVKARAPPIPSAEEGVAASVSD
ncbi:MFP1 attachment factor 1 [Glycine soja]